MIGDDYFQLRSRIGAELQALGVALREVPGAEGAAEEIEAILLPLLDSLKAPFFLMVVGEPNTGKSTFLNALFGEDFAKAGGASEGEKALYFKHGPEKKLTPITPALLEVQAPAAFLQDFHILNTPAACLMESEHQSISERFMPMADVLLFVLSAMDPWAASAWQFLEKACREQMRHVVLVLQQSDLRGAEEIQVISDYVGELCRTRFGREFPLFAISGKKAHLARNGRAIGAETLLEESGLLKLEAHLNRLVLSQPMRQRKLLGSLQAIRQLLEQICERSVAAMRSIQSRVGLLEELLTEGELQADRTLKKLLPALEATERDYHEGVLRVAGLTNDLLATRRAFQRSPSAEEETARPKSLDHRLLHELHHRTDDRWRQMSLVLEEDVRQHDRYVRAHGRHVLPEGFGEPEARPGAENDLRRRFTTRIDSALRRFVLALRLDDDIEPGLQRARQTARWLPILIPILALLASVAGWLAGWQAAVIATGSGGMLVAMVYLLTQMRLAAARNAILDKLEESTGTLREMLADQLREESHHAFSKVRELLEPLQNEANAVQQAAAQVVERLQRLGDTVETLAADVARLGKAV